MPNVVLFDIESTNLNADFGYILCIGWKRLGDKRTQVRAITDYPSFAKDPTRDGGLVRDVCRELGKADMWITWYGSRFDVPMLQSRLMVHGGSPMPPVPHVDLWRTCRYKLHIHSNRLASFSAFAGLEEKTQLRGPEWVKAAAGHKPSIRYIVEHCRQDVEVLEQAYGKLRPHVHAHPNLALVYDETEPPRRCPICYAENSLRAKREKVARVSRATLLQCSKCGGWSQGPYQKDENIFAR